MKQRLLALLLASLILAPCLLFSQTGNLQNAYAYQRKATEFLAKVDYKNSISTYDTSIELYPKQSFLYIGRAWAKNLSKNYSDEEILKDYKEAISLNPKVGYNYSARASFYANKKMYKEAIADLDEAIILSPYVKNFYSTRTSYKLASGLYSDEEILSEYNTELSLIYLWDKATFYYRKKMFPEAISNLESYLKQKPSWFSAETLIRYRKESKLYSHEAMIADFNTFIGENPLTLKTRINKAQFLKDIGLFKESLAENDTIVSLEPNVAEHYRKRAGVKTDLGLYDAAQADYQKALDIAPNDASIYFMRGIMWTKMYKYKTAIEDYNTALKCDSNAKNVYFQRALTYLHTKNYKGAIDDNNVEITRNPKFQSAYINRGIAKGRMGNYEGAFADYQKVLTLWPNYSLAISNMAWTNLYLGDTIDGMPDLNKVVSLNPKYRRGLNNQLYALYNNANYDECIKRADYVIANCEELEGTYFSRGKAKDKLGQYNEAIDDYNKTLEAYQNNPARLDGDHDDVSLFTNTAKAESEISLGMLDSAIANSTKAIDFDSSYKQAYNTRGLAYYLSGKYQEAVNDYDKAMDLSNGNSYYQPLFQYRNEAANARKGSTPTPLIYVEWLSPRDNVNHTFRGALYVAGQKELPIKLRINSAKELSQNEIKLYENWQVLEGLGMKITMKNVHTFTANYEYELEATIPLPPYICQLKVGYQNNYSQLLTIYQDRFPVLNQSEKFSYSWSGFPD
jgi:serine/threonine-protein kinase